MKSTKNVCEALHWKKNSQEANEWLSFKGARRMSKYCLFLPDCALKYKPWRSTQLVISYFYAGYEYTRTDSHGSFFRNPLNIPRFLMSMGEM